METKPLAIANFRVSSDEQLKNGSISRQETAIRKAANDLGVEIVRVWSGSVSSKKWNNINRKDLLEMIEECKKNRRIKYILFDEVDRFMRSMLEIGHYIVEFKKLQVEVKFASQPDISTESAHGTLMLMLEAFKAEGSNEERQRKSVNGLTEAIRNGKWPFQPKTGYQKGRIDGVPEIDPARGVLLREAMISIVEHRATPSEALAQLNKTDFIKGRPKYKMDKFRKVCTDPFYAGILEMDKQVKYRNENGLHEPLITKDQHKKLVEIFSNKKKCQSGPRKNGNPDFPLSNIVHCEKCQGKRYNRYVGVPITNGVNKERVYYKYRCRECNHSLDRDALHLEVSNHIARYEMSDQDRNSLTKSLCKVWGERRSSEKIEKMKISNNISSLKKKIDNLVDNAMSPGYATIREEIIHKIERLKEECSELELKYETYDATNLEEKERFLEFALKFANDISKNFMNLPKARLLQCKQMLFPAGFWIDENKNVYTPEVSLIYSVMIIQKDPLDGKESSMVRHS